MNPPSDSKLRSGAIAMMTAACGIAVANVYLCQPLLPAIATSFSISADQAGNVATAAQIGYALGILLVVPVADRINSRKLIRVLLALTTLFLLAAAAAPSIHLLVAASLAITLTTVIAQVLIPVAVSTVPSERAGSIVGTLQSGLIAGILLSRTVSGIIGEYAGNWRFSYVTAAACTGILFLALPPFLPAKAAGQAKVSYLQLLASLPTLIVRWPQLRLSALLGALIFGSFSAFWATLAFHLAKPPFDYGSAQAGLFGLWGAVGALSAPMAGKLADRYGPNLLNGVAIAAVVLAFALFGSLGSMSVIAIVIGVNFLDFGNQAGQIANQTRIFKLDPTARARLNTVYMVATFAGGAIGSGIGSHAWSAFAWSGVWTAGLVLTAVAAILLLGWSFIDRRRPS